MHLRTFFVDILTIVHCALHALEVTNLNAVVSNLLGTCLKSQSLPNSIIFITESHLHKTLGFKGGKYLIVFGS